MKKKVWKTIFVISVLGCMLCVFGMAWYVYQDREAERAYEAVQDQVVKEEAKLQKEEKGEEGMNRSSQGEKSQADREEEDARGNGNSGDQSFLDKTGQENQREGQEGADFEVNTSDQAEKTNLEEDQPSLEEVQNVEFTGEREGEEASLPEDIFLDMENPIDFQRLQEINSDLYAWIEIPGTKIHYPIAQREGDDTYYLTHDMYQKPRFAGCIYTEDGNSKSFTDPNTVIYGHNMKNESMFQNLHLFADRSFFDRNPYVYIYTPDQVLIYKIFAAYTYDDRHLLNSFDFQDRAVFEQYLQGIQNVRSMNKNLRADVEVTTEDKILTLVTCIGGQTRSRYLVQAVLVQS